MEHQVFAQSIIMQDLGPNSSEQSSSTNRYLGKEKELDLARLEYIKQMLQVEIEIPSPTPDTKLTLEAELKTLEAKIKSMEGKMTEFLPRPIALSPQNSKPKVVKRPAAPVTKPAKSNKSKNTTDSDFVFPKKTAKNTPLEEKKEIKINNTFEALTSDKTDVQDVTPAYKIKPIFMKIIDSYNLVLQDLHRKYPTATNTHTKGYIKIEAQTENDHNEIVNYLKDKNLEFYLIEPPLSTPLKLVIKGLPVDIDPEDIKNELISKGIKIVKTTQLKRFITKTPPYLYDRDST
ncbi:uncharacterized protein TNCV_2456381 [Trichonephila clavipes]|nr:uncharacterized protein TNCV_2456381 [Trichonephila clavipes]